MSRIGERRRHYQDDDGGRSRKRRRTNSVDIEDRLESLITRVGEKSNSSLESNLEGLANVLEADLSNYKERILKIICTCATNLPEKVTVYSTLVGLLNGKNYNCGEEFLDMMMDNLRDVMVAYQFERARLMVRFIADLVNCRVVLPSSLLELFEKFLAATMENDAPQVRSDWFIYTILSALPWVGKELSEKRGSDFERILSTLEDYISHRKKTHVAALRVWSTDNPHPQEEYLDCLWAQIKNLKANNWQEKHIRRPYLAFDDVLADALQHVLPTVTLPPHKEDVTYPLPAVVYRMFDYTDVPEGPAMPGAHSIERFLVEEGIRRVINSHSKDRKECANQLVNMSGRSKVPHNYCIVEVLFSEMLRLPESPQAQIYYGSLFIELCKLQQSAMPGVLAQATELIFDRVDTMNTTCIDRFVDWFSYHLSNFHFKWSWDDWLPAAENPDLPRYRFLCELFEKLKRFMYQQFVAQLLPEGLQMMVPPAPEPLYRFTPDKTDLPGVDIAKQLLEAIRAKKDQDELQTILNEISHNAMGQPDSNDINEQSFPALRIEVLLHTLLKLGSKSISHTFNALTKFQKLIKDLVVNEEAQVHVLRTVKEFWQDHPQMLVVLVEKLLKMRIVESASVVNWLLDKDMTEDFMRKYTWEIMAATMKKMNNMTSQTEKQVKDTKHSLEAQEEKAKKEVENGEQEDEKAKQHKTKMREEIETKQQLLDEVTEKWESVQREQKQLFLIAFQRFILILTEHLVRCEQHQMDVNTHWFRYATDRLREILLSNHHRVFQYQTTLETLLFTSDLDSHILDVFNQFKALRA